MPFVCSKAEQLCAALSEFPLLAFHAVVERPVLAYVLMDIRNGDFATALVRLSWLQTFHLVYRPSEKFNEIKAQLDAAIKAGGHVAQA